MTAHKVIASRLRPDGVYVELRREKRRYIVSRTNATTGKPIGPAYSFYTRAAAFKEALELRL